MQGKYFKRIAVNIDVTPVLSALVKQSHLWSEITARQDYPGTAHADTETIFLRWCKNETLEAAFSEIPAIDYPAFAKLPEARVLLNQIGELICAKEIGRVLLTKLKPHGEIDRHTDEGDYCAHYDRFHLSLVTGEGCTFFAGEPEFGEFVHMKPGELWWFDNKSPHWLTNPTSTDRVHLIVDAVTEAKWK